MKILKHISLALIAVMCMSCADKTSTITKEKAPLYNKVDIPKISVQLWSVKHQLKSDFKGTLTEIADMGFDGVELAGEFGSFKNDAKGLKNFLDGLGLEVSAAHANFDVFEGKKYEETVAFYKVLETDTLIIPWDERAWSTTEFDSFINDLTTLYSKLKQDGFKLGFHNHDQEFNQYKDSTFWDHIAQSTPQDFVLQMDVGWVSFAGKSPVEYINRYPGRTVTTHIKAKLPKSLAEPHSNRPIVGEDLIDWTEIVRADINTGGTKWFVVEQEEYPDGLTPLQAVKLSKKGLDKAISKLEFFR